MIQLVLGNWHLPKDRQNIAARRNEIWNSNNHYNQLPTVVFLSFLGKDLNKRTISPTQSLNSLIMPADGEGSISDLAK